MSCEERDSSDRGRWFLRPSQHRSPQPTARIAAWRAARRLAMTIYRLTEATDFREDADLRRQMRRASAALMSDVAELYHAPIGAGSLHSIRHARSAVIRLLSYLACAVDRCYIERETFEDLSESAEELKEEIAEYFSCRA